jgi:phosphatidylserine/phosphatidylglycerophosphate/cardiolipin synthase-like enzyme
MADRLALPVTVIGLRRYVEGPLEASLEDLSTLHEQGWTARQVGLLLTSIAAERATARAAEESVELVWTGPELAGSASRDTAVVVGQLFRTATRTVLLSGFVVYKGFTVFEALAARMEEIPGLEVRLFLNVGREKGDARPDDEIVAGFAKTFREKQWPGKVVPAVFYDPRALTSDRSERAVLHAKCVVVDGEQVFLTSANFTEAAQRRNIEAGLLLRSSGIARNLSEQFERLVNEGTLLRLPGA